MRFGVDIDGVLADFQNGWAETYERYWPGRLNWSKLDEWDAIETQTHFDTVEEFWEWTDLARIWEQLAVVDGSQGALYDLNKQGVRIEFITNRAKKPWVETATSVWLMKHFGFIQGVQFRIHQVKNKASVPCTLYVDDSPFALADLHEAGMRAVRYERPWNSKKDPAIAVARNWDQVKQVVEEEMSQ